MSPTPDRSARNLLKRVTALASAALLTALSSACSVSLPRNEAAQDTNNTPQPVKALAPSAPAPVITSAVIVPVPPDSLTGGVTLRILTYADRVRQLQGPELSQEISRQSESSTPVAQLQLSLALSQLRQLPELLKAQELLARVLGNPEAAALHPLTRLLASRYVEQRRLEEQIERQTQQLRDTQRRLDQTNDRLEALKAIERSLVSRPAGATSAPTNPARHRSAP